MRIALITIHNVNNYGALLQTLACQQTLAEFGDVRILNYDNPHISSTTMLIRVRPSLHGILGMGKDLVRLAPRYRVLKKIKTFLDEKLNMTESYSRNQVFDNISDGYDVFVAGSDQIWNPRCVSSNRSLDPVYFLDFVGDSKRKISYASSIGGYLYDEQETKWVVNRLNSFDAISVREADTKRYLDGLLDKSVEHVLDPTLLLSKSQWLEHSAKCYTGQKSKNYILLYSVPGVPIISEAVQTMSRKLGLPVIALDQGLFASGKVDMQIRDAGPDEFLSLFSGAAFVITDSFHGTCFSLIFEKPFIALAQGVHTNRIESLLQSLGCTDRMAKTAEEIDRVELSMDFDEAHSKLNSHRAKSINFLRRALNQ